MSGAELQLLFLIAVGFGVLFLRHRFRVDKRRRLAAKRGLRYELRGLQEVPGEFQHTLLFAIADGGHERDVVSGDLVINEESVGFHGFELAFQRDVRGEWAFAATDPPFRLFSPATVLVYQLPRKLAHLVVKRCGRADAINEEVTEVYKSLASIAREMTIIDRVIAVPAPAAIGRRPIEHAALASEYRVWAESPEQARMILTNATSRYLRSLAAGGREIVFELLGSLLVVYCASDAALSDGDTLALGTFADELCRQILENTPRLTPRGVGY